MVLIEVLGFFCCKLRINGAVLSQPLLEQYFSIFASLAVCWLDEVHETGETTT